MFIDGLTYVVANMTDFYDSLLIEFKKSNKSLNLLV